LLDVGVYRLCPEQEGETVCIDKGEKGKNKLGECCGIIVGMNTGSGAESTIKGRVGMFGKLLELEL
jgi:hypothetical protein